MSYSIGKMGILPKPKMTFRRTTLLTVWFVAFLVGLVLSRIVFFPLGWVVVLPLGISLVFAFRRNWLSVCLLLLSGLLIGMWRGGMMLHTLAPYQALYGKHVVLEVVAGEDAVYGTNTQLTFETHDMQFLQPFSAHLAGRVKIGGFGETAVFKGDRVRVEGKLQPVRGGRQGQISFAQLKVLERGNGSVDTVRRKFAAGTYSALPEPLASFGLGILIGQRTTLPADVSKQLAVVGLTHIIAVSGYNLTIIIDAVRRLLGRRSKYQIVLCIVLLTVLFLAMTGLSASIVRASLVSGFSLAAWYYGRTFKPLLLISMVAALTAAWNPLYIWGDIGWYLSFLAFFGVLVVAPLVIRRIYVDREPKFVQSVLLETLSAQIMTIPLILYIFQQFSFVAIISNVLIVPLVPLAMLVSLIAGLAGMWMPVVAGWLAWPARLVLTYILDLAAVLSRVPHALARVGLPVGGLVAMYALLVVGIIVLWRKTPKLATITDEELDK